MLKGTSSGLVGLAMAVAEGELGDPEPPKFDASIINCTLNAFLMRTPPCDFVTWNQQLSRDEYVHDYVLVMQIFQK